MTIKDIAKKANVSIGTVDRVLHKRGGVNADTKQKIEEIILADGYKGNVYARNLKLGKDCKIGVLLPVKESEFGYWNLVYEGIDKARVELESFGVLLLFEYFDRDLKGDFTQKLQQLLTLDCTGLLIAPLCVDELSTFDLSSISIPIEFIDSQWPMYNPVSVIAQNPYQGGFVAGRIMKLLADGFGKFVCVQIHSDAFNSFERARGFKSFIEQDGRNKVIDIDIRNLQELPTIMDRLFAENDDLKGIFTVNCIINSVGKYLVHHKLKDKIVAVGYDLVPENVKALKQGYVDCIISQRPTYQGYTAINQLYRYLMLEDEPLADIEIPIDVYFKENLTEGVE